MVPVLLRPFPQLHHVLPNKMLQRPKHSFRRSVNQALGIFQKPNDMYVCMYKPTAPCKKLSASPKKPSDSGKKTSSLWWSWPKNAIKSKNHSEGGQHFKDAILSSAHVNYIQNSCFFMVQFQGQYFEVDSGVGWPKNEACMQGVVSFPNLGMVWDCDQCRLGLGHGLPPVLRYMLLLVASGTTKTFDLYLIFLNQSSH